MAVKTAANTSSSTRCVERRVGNIEVSARAVMEFLVVQILVEVANSQIESLTTDVDEGSERTVVGLG